MSNLDFFVTSKDDGTSVAASIQPITNTEPANQTNLQRPAENLRTRTQAIKEAFDGFQAMQQLDRSWVVAASNAGGKPTLTWSDVTKKFISGAADTLIMPLISGASSGGAQYQLPALNYSAGTFKVLSKLKMYEGGGNIFFQMFTSAIAVATVTVVGTLANVEKESVTIILEMPVGTTNTDAITAINNHGVANLLVTASTTAGAVAVAAPLLAATLTRQRLYAISNGALHYGVGGYDSTSYVIQKAVWEDASVVLPEGSTLAINFATVRAARAKDNDGLIATSDLVVLTTDTFSYVGDGSLLPLAKNVDGTVYFFNGVVLNDGVVTELILDPATQTDFNAHVAGTADTHPIKAIKTTTRPFVVVGATTGCDYSSITAAVAGITAVGGTIYVQPGTYNLAGPIVLGAKPIEIIGIDAEDTIINAAAGQVTVQITGVEKHRLKNLTLKQTTAAKEIVLSTALGSSGGTTVSICAFEGCVLTRETNAAVGARAVESNVSMSFSKCKFSGYAVGAAVDVGFYLDTTLDAYAKFTFDQCYFYKYAIVMRTIGANVIGKLVVHNCEFYDCGASVAAAGTWTYLLRSTSGGDHEITHNHWNAHNGDNAECGGFCLIEGSGEVSHNQLLRPASVANNTAGAFAISAIPQVTGDTIKIDNNKIICTTAASLGVGGIYGSCVTNNYIDRLNPTSSNQKGISLPSVASLYKTLCEGNLIIYALAAPAPAGAIYSATQAHICNNRILQIGDGNTGIEVAVAGTNSMIRGNIVSFTAGVTSNTGIKNTARDAHVAENLVYNAETGISSDGAGVIISNNRVDGDSGGADIVGISLAGTTSTDCSIVGNNINDVTYGIFLSFTLAGTGMGLVISGNNIRTLDEAAATGIYAAAGAIAMVADMCITGNRILGANIAVGSGIYINTAAGTISNVGIGSNFVRNYASLYDFTNCVEIGMMDGSPNNNTDALTKNWAT